MNKIIPIFLSLSIIILSGAAYSYPNSKTTRIIEKKTPKIAFTAESTSRNGYTTEDLYVIASTSTNPNRITNNHDYDKVYIYILVVSPNGKKFIFSNTPEGLEDNWLLYDFEKDNVEQLDKDVYWYLDDYSEQKRSHVSYPSIFPELINSTTIYIDPVNFDVFSTQRRITSVKNNIIHVYDKYTKLDTVLVEGYSPVFMDFNNIIFIQKGRLITMINIDSKTETIVYKSDSRLRKVFVIPQK